MKVGIVTDSTCDIPLLELEQLGVKMVPLKVLFQDATFLDWVELQPEEFYSKLKVAPVLPKTSQPSPAEFLAAYKELAEKGCEAIVSIHLSSPLSGTYQSASLAAVDSPVPVHVIDTHEVTQGLALSVKAAVDARNQGLDAEKIAEHTREIAGKTHLFFILDTLEYLVKGGRAGKAQGLAASLLNIKPVLIINDDGIIEPFKKVKGRKKAMMELAAHVAEEARQYGRLRLAILHACAPELAKELTDEIIATGADIEIVSTGLVGSVVGTYAGPDAIGCAFYPVA